MAEVVTELRVGKASLKKDLDDARREFSKFSKDIQREAATLFAQRGTPGGAFGSPMGARNFAFNAGGAGGGVGGLKEAGKFTRGIGSAVASIAVVEGLLETGGLVAQGMGAAADAMKGNTRAAVDKLADMGEEAKKLPLIGNIARPLERFLGFITGINAQIAQLEKETAELDAKTARMAKKNQAIRGANAKFQGIIDAGAVRSAEEQGGPSAGRLVEIRKQIKELDELIKATPGADKDKAKAARQALVDEENRLKAEGATTREKQERDHQNKLTDIQAEGNAARLRAAADAEQDEGKRRDFERAADRVELDARQKAQREAIIGKGIGGTPEEQKRAQEEVDALKPTQEAERAAMEAKFGREDRERAEKEAEEAEKEAEKKRRAFEKLMDDLTRSAEQAAEEEEKAYQQVFRDQMKRLHDQPVGGGFGIAGESFGAHLQNAILSSPTGTEAGTIRAAAKELEKAAERMASLPLIGVVDRQ